MSEHNEKPDDKQNDNVADHDYVDGGRPGSEFETREMPALKDSDDADKADSPVLANPDKPGSTSDTIVATRNQADARPAFEPVEDSDDGEEATAMVTRGAGLLDDMETREVPALKDEWRERASDAAASLGDAAEVVGEWGGEEGDASLAASVAAASGMLPLPQTEEPAEIAGPIIEGARLAQMNWARLRFEQRLPYFDKLRAEMVNQRSDYVPSMATAIGRPMVETLTGEYLPVLEALRTLEDIVPPLLVDQHAAGVPVTHEGITTEVRMAPFGVVLIANDRQSPFSLPMTLMIDALATGNAVLFCASEFHPRVNETMRRLFQRAGMPENLVQVLGGDSDTLKTLIDARPDKVFFEGDDELATRVAARCAESGCAVEVVRKVKNMLVVLEGANLERALHAALTCAFASGGMRAGTVERIVIDAAIYDEFRMRFIDAIRTMNSHHAQLASINDHFNPRRAQMLVEDAVARGARVTYPAGEEPGRWIQWKAAVFEVLPPKAKLSTERFEGPGCALYRADVAVDETLRILRLLPASNVSVLGPTDRGTRAKFEELPAARISFNDPLLLGASTGGGVPVGPETPRSTAATASMLRAKVITGSEDQGRRVAWFPYTDDKAYALMDAIEAIYGVRAGKRIKAALKIAINPTMGRLLRGEE
ncbi:MAG: aldehyde dehydrogenase family protein [Planctomycetes bacterium]|nr:aldehyde dehydrogenase family protein [Planctomycetota bacterium]